MTPEEKAKTLETLQHVRQQIDALHAEAFTIFVEAVHNLGLMLTPISKNQEVLAYKLTEIESKLREEALNDSPL
jgi:hypothetical protein